MFTHVGTRRSSELGATFLTGVDRRVHAPLGTVIKFSRLVAVTSGTRSRGLCSSVVGRGSRVLLRLVGSVLSLTGVRTNALRCVECPVSLKRLYHGICRVRGSQIRAKIILVLSGGSADLVVGRSRGQVVRIIAGLVAGTVGFAFGKRVHFNFRIERRCVSFCMGSAKVNVSRRGVGVVFRHFIGLGAFIRKANLKLTVYEIVMRGLNKRVATRSGLGRNSAFHFAVPCGTNGGVPRSKGTVGYPRSKDAKPEGILREEAMLITRSMSDGFLLLGALLKGEYGLL